ncbi:replication endonuclease [Arsenophonus apicola]|uniref:Replication endonuclease n=1 Tax=Arsenophonus apicola TaxID=2879119 RepID=A0ABY8P7Z7_9GAMM|nr:replication endonuclease [Arsenophonus apicola]WGO84694.1 replication endonuclease [Arsenophonus apicola]
MRHRTIDFSVSPVTYTADMQFQYWWNKPRHQAVCYPRPLTHKQIVQGQRILKDIASLPPILRYRYQKRYDTLIKDKGLHAAHHFLYFTFQQKIWPRLVAVNQRYEMQLDHWPLTFIKTVDIGNFNLLPTMNDNKLKQLAASIAAGFFNFYESQCDNLIASHGGERAVIFDEVNQTTIYGRLAELSLALHVSPENYPFYQAIMRNRHQYNSQQNMPLRKVYAAVARLISRDYWLNKLKSHRTKWLESLMIAAMEVCQNKQPYASQQAIRAVKSQRLANLRYLQAMEIEDIDSGEHFDLIDKVMASISNPEIRRMELMAQMAGIEKVAMERKDIGMFVTLTCPSKYHPTKLRQRGKNNIAVLNHKWKNEAFTPKDGQRYLVKVWSRIRAAFADNEVNVYGVRVVEPHHDATPHWHLLLFTDKASRAKAIEIMRQKALADDPDEKGAQQHRFACKHMNKGGAVGYIAKYIAKNIDGYALDGDVDFETGKPLTEMAAAVTTWASTWRIPQFHFYNLPSKGVYRECRRLRSVSVADKLGEIAEQVRKAADEGDFAAYIQAQGGPCTPRNQQTLRVAYQTNDQLNAYDEEVQKVVGIYAQLNPIAEMIKTRCRKYRLVKKVPASEDEELLKSAIGAPRSSGNNCRNGGYDGDLDRGCFESGRVSGLINNLYEYGFTFIKTGAERRKESILPADKST